MQLLEVCSDKLLSGSCLALFMAWYSLIFPKLPPPRSVRLRYARAAGDVPGLGAEFCVLADRDFMLASALWGLCHCLDRAG